jgi:hypothetical protein
MKINTEARARPSAADLRRSIVDFGLPMQSPPQSGGPSSGKSDKGDKEARRAAKALKKEKKEKKAKKGGADGSVGAGGENGAGEGEGDDAVQLPVNVDAGGVQQQRTGEPSPSPQPPADGPSSATAAYAATAAAGSSSAAAPAIVAPLAVNVTADDLFSFLDNEAATKALPALGATPKNRVTVSGAKPSGADTMSPPPPRSRLSPQPSGNGGAIQEDALVPSPRPTTAPGGPAVSRASSLPDVEASPQQQAVDADAVDILVLETIHARVLGGEIIEFAIWGEILLNCSVVPETPRRFDFQIFNTDAMTKVSPNTAVLSGGQQGAWSAMIPAGTEAPLCVLKYKVATSLETAAGQVPLRMDVKWKCTEQETVVDVEYELQRSSALAAASSSSSSGVSPPSKLLDVKFLIALAPEKSIASCVVAQPKCLFSPQSQKMMWQFAQLPGEDAPSERKGRLHAELSNNNLACQPSPLSVSFMSDDLESVVSKILVTEGDRRPGSNTLPLGRLIYRVKSGIYTVY